MNDKTNPTQVADDVVVSLDYTLTVDGQVLDSSEGNEPIEFIQGHGHIIPGLEKALYGMQVGESKTVVVSAADGYGEVDPSAILEVPRSEFPPHIPLQEGVELQVRDAQGHEMYARIAAVGAETVRLDFNHPLAGKELHFQVTVAGLRQATSEELAHDHVH